MGGGRNIEVRPGTMTQGNKYERECLDLQIRKRHHGRTARVALAAHKPFAPVSRSSCRQAQAPARLWSKPPLTYCGFLFSLHGWTLVHTQSTSNAAALAFTRCSAANRRQNHKNFALQAARTKSATVGRCESPEGTETWLTGDETLLYAHSWQELQRGGPRTRKQS